MRIITDAEIIELGVTEATPTVGMTDYSRRVTDEFGTTTVTKRAFSRRLSVKVKVPSGEAGALQAQVAALRATAVTWEADASSEWLSPIGYYKDFNIDFTDRENSFCTLRVEGLSETEVAPDPGGDPAPVGTSTLSFDNGGIVSLLGVTEANANAGINDYSITDFDEFGDPLVVPRAWAKRMSVNALIRTDMIDAVANRLAAIRATVVNWSADSAFQSLQMEGFWKEWSIERGKGVSKLTISVEGISDASDLPTFDDVFKGIQTDRYPTEAPTDPKIGSIYFDGNLKPYRFEGRYIFNGESQIFNGTTPIYGSGWVSVRDKGLTEIVDDLQALDDDGKLTVIEKKIAIERDRQLENIYNGVIQQANALGYDASAVISARLDYITIRNSIVPAWNDTTQPSDFSNTGWDLVLDLYEAAIADAQADMTAIAGVTVEPPPAQTVLVDHTGTAAPGEFPRTLTPIVRRGAVDIRTTDDVSYSIALTGSIVATVNNTAGSADKGKITVTAGTTGMIDLTVTVKGVETGPFSIPFTTRKDEGSLRLVYQSGGTLVYASDFGGVTHYRMTGNDTIGSNTTKTITFPFAFTTICNFIASGATSDTSKEGAAANYANTLTTGSVVNSTNVTVPFSWSAEGY